jgi:hypothetical protein
MISPVRSPAPRALAILVAVIVLAGVPFAVVGGFGMLVYPPYAGIGALLAIRRHRNPIGWLLIGLSWTFLFAFVPTLATATALQAGTASLFEMLLSWSSAWLPTVGFAFLLAIMITFPAGNLPSGRWRRPAIVAIGAAASAVVLAALVPTFKVTIEHQAEQVVTLPNPFTFLPDAPPWDWLTGAFPYPVFVALLLAGAGSMVVRARRATGQERQQLRWVVAAFAGLASAVPSGFAILIVFGDGATDVAWLPALLSFLLPPIAIGIAILRYRLYDIDRLISRTIGWALVKGVLVAVFAGTVLGLQAILTRVTQGQTFAVAASTLIAFALFQPVRRRVQRVVDRRFDRARYDGDLTAAAFAEHLRQQVDLAGLESDIAGVVDNALRPTSVGVWIRRSGHRGAA